MMAADDWIATCTWPSPGTSGIRTSLPSSAIRSKPSPVPAGYNPLTHGPADNIRDIRKTRTDMFTSYLAPDGRSDRPEASSALWIARVSTPRSFSPPLHSARSHDVCEHGPGPSRGAFNDWLHDFCTYDPTRLKMNALIPLLDIDGAVAEIQRAKADLGAAS